MNLAKTLWFFMLLLCLCKLRAQECKWLSTDSGGSGNEYAYAVAVDNADNSIAVGTYTDAFQVDTFHLYNVNGANMMGFLVKYDTDGNVLWVRQTYIAGSLDYAYFTDVETDDSNNVYVVGVTKGSVDFGSGFSISTSTNTYYTVLLKYSPAGIPQWMKLISSSSGASYNPFVVVDYDNNPVMGFSFSGNISFSGSTKTLTSVGTAVSDFGVVKYTRNGAFVNTVGFGGIYDDLLQQMGKDGDNSIYLLVDSYSDFTFGSQNLTDTGSCVLKLDSAFNPVKAFKHDLYPATPSSQGISVRQDGDFVVVGLFKGTVDFGGVTLVATNGVGNQNSYIAYYNSDFTARWVRKDDPVSLGYISPTGHVFFRDDNIYSGGLLSNNDSYFGSMLLTYTGSGTNLYIVKLDTLGNFLWAFASGGSSSSMSYVQDISVDLNGNAILVGAFIDNITVFNLSHTSSSSITQDYFAAKVSDYQIFRGNVSAGPYCAGDTLKVPYTIRGKFGAGNEFIAQLSDSAGNFDGGERELGRVTDTAAGTINGLLPLFNVATTNKYRIRIISTNPVVQSFYKLDTLRLLIYSKDTANAGSDTTICSGQSIRLGTTGGSRWRWWPSTGFVNQADTANRQPLVKPAVTTQYRIIISDSSGCGEIDTDYVVVNVRPYITATINGPSTICRGAQAKLQVTATGGDSTRYWYQWKESMSVTVFSKDPYVFVNPLKKTTYIMTMGDSCSNKPAIVNFTITVDTVLKVYKVNDTTICKGATTQLKAWGSGCDSSQYRYTWQKLGDTTIISTNDTLTVAPTTTAQYKVILRDISTVLVDSAIVKVTIDNVFITTASKDSIICLGQSIQLTANTISCDTTQIEYTWDNGPGKGQSPTVSPTTTTTYTVIAKNLFNGLSDTDKVTITVRNALSLSVNPDTTICKGETAQLRATATGGKPTAYKTNWTADNSGWTDTSFITSVSPDTTTIYTAILSDGCTVKSDTARIKISVRPPLKVTVNADTIICIGETAELRAVANGGLPASWKLLWKADNASWTDTKFSETVNPVSTTNYTVVLSDNCTKQNDSATIKVTVRPSLKVTLNKDTTICYAGSVNLVANTSGGLNTNHHILWKENLSSWTDTNFSLTVSPISTTTYTATLTDNCTANPDSAKVTVTVLPPLSITATAKDSICQGQTVTLNATLSGGKTTAHTLNWTAIPGTFSSNQNPAVDTPAVNTSYIAKLSDNCSPNAYDTINVVVLPKPKADFSLFPAAGCPPLSVTFTDLSANTDSAKNTWHILTSEAYGVKSYTHEFLYSGSFSIGLTVGNSLGCTDFINKPSAITVFEKPTANFTVKPDIKEVEKELLLINNSQKANQYLWDFGDGNAFSQFSKNDTNYTYKDSGYYNLSLIAENDKGCKDTSSQLIRVHDRFYCAIPNAFTPGNNDNLNPVFQPVCTGVKSYTMTIYNRWGQIIQHCNDCGWDGTYMDKPVPSETYMYQLQITGFSGKKETVFGVVNVVR